MVLRKYGQCFMQFYTSSEIWSGAERGSPSVLGARGSPLHWDVTYRLCNPLLCPPPLYRAVPRSRFCRISAVCLSKLRAIFWLNLLFLWLM
jgi:hypothetical protein